MGKKPLLIRDVQKVATLILKDKPTLAVEKLKEMFPEAFLQKGHWYETQGVVFLFLGETNSYGVRNDKGAAIGFNARGNWSDIYVYKGEVYKCVSPDKVAKLMFKEAIKRGFSLCDMAFEHKKNRLLSRGGVIFDGENWATVCKPTLKGWYLSEHDDLIYIYQEDGKTFHYGISRNNRWIEKGSEFNESIYGKLSRPGRHVISERLLHFVELKGFVKGTYFKNVLNGERTLISKDIEVIPGCNGYGVYCNEGLIFYEGVWAEIDNAPEHWYVSKYGVKMYFLSTEDAYGFRNDRTYVKPECGYNINDPYQCWKLADTQEIAGLLLAKAMRDYPKFGTVVQTAHQDTETVGMVGKISFSGNGHNINSNADGDFSVTLFHEPSGSWAKTKSFV